MQRTRKKLYEIVFEADTREGKIFDVFLIILILASVGLVLADSVESVNRVYASELMLAELIITALFTAEYILRIYIVDKPARYIFSFFGIIDLLAIIPGFLIFMFTGAQSLMVIRAIRLIRVFRVLKLTRYTSAGRMLGIAMYRSREKIFMFLAVILTMVLIFGTVMYMVEGKDNGFTNIPTSIYWAIVTLTTVGYGDISPATGAGQLIASLIMIMGYAIIAVPTGIVTSEMIRMPGKLNTRACSKCLYNMHDDDALYCKKCGNSLITKEPSDDVSE